MWTTIAEAPSPEELVNASPIVDEVPAGTRMRIEVYGWGLGKLADMLGAEYIAQQLVPAGFFVTDVFGTGWNMGTIEGTMGEAQGAGEFRLAFAGGIVALLGVVGGLLWALGKLITSIKVKGENIKVGDGDGGFLDFLQAPLMLAVVGGVVILYLSRRKQ